MSENLPKSSDDQDQERTSLIKFSNLIDSLKRRNFLVREESGGDFGVDRILEIKLKINGYEENTNVTNYRSHIQMKSLKNTKRLKSDNTVSYGVKTKNINYLMNQPNSLFIIYLEDEDIFLWEWITEINNYCKSHNIDITDGKQEEVNFHFRKELNSDNLDQIHSRITEVGKVVRVLNDATFLLSKPTENQSYIISRESNINELKIENTEELINYLKNNGLILINYGFSGKVNELLDKIPNNLKKDLEISLVESYSKYNSGELFNALASLPRNEHEIQVLSEDRRILIKYLELTLKFSLNIINKEAYQSQLSKIQENPESLISLQIKLHNKMMEFTSQENLYVINDKGKELSEIANKILQLSIDEQSRLQAEISLFWLKGFKVNENILDLVFRSKYLKESGRGNTEEVLNILNSIRTENVNFVSEWIDLKIKVKDNPFLIGFLTERVVSLLLFQIVFILTINNEDRTQEQLEEGAYKTLKLLYDELEYSSKILLSIGERQVGLRNKLMKSEILELLNMKDASIKLISEVISEAKILGFEDLISIANNQLNGHSIFSFVKQTIEKINNSEGNIDKEMLESMNSLEAMESLIKDTMEWNSLPQDRYENVKKMIYWNKEDLRDKTFWCKYIETFENLTHSKTKETMYSTDPELVIHCKLLDYRSNKGLDRNTLINEFKNRYCQNCNKRTIE